MMVRSGKATEVCDSLLIGYLGVLKCLVFMLSPEEKYQVGLREGGCRLIKVCGLSLLFFHLPVNCCLALSYFSPHVDFVG